MKTVVKIGFLVLFLASFFLSPDSVLAQHACACTPDCNGNCALPVCSLACTGCDVGEVTNLRYQGDGNTEVVTLLWDAAQYASSYYVNVLLNGTSITGFPKSVTDTTTNFTYSLGNKYTWTVLPRNVCDNGIITPGPDIGIPNFGSLTLAYGVSGECTDSNCNGEDMIVGLDQNYDQQVPIRVTATDGNGGDDIEYLYVLLDNNMAYEDGSLLRIKYTNDGSADGILEIENDDYPNNSKYSEIAIVPGSYSRTINVNNLTLDFNLDLSSLSQENFFLTNIYTNTRDFTNIGTGRILKIGTGNTEEKPADPYAGNAVNALDVWNGRDVAVTNVGFYQLDNYLDVCNQVAGWDSLPAVGTTDLEASYSPLNDWLASLTSWNTSTHYQPYYYYNNQNQQAIYAPGVDSSIILRGMSSEAFGGPCVEAVGGNVTSNFKNGGVREEDSGIGDASKQTAFAVIEVADSWSQIYDGSLFSNSDFILGIEPMTCPACVLMDVNNSDNNGLLMVNGTIDAKANVSFGINQDWYAQSVSGDLPFRNLEIDKTFAEIKNMYSAGTYTEYSGDQEIGSSGTIISIANNQTYFIDGNLTVASSTLLEVPENDYLLFVINGDLTITNAVKDSAAGADNSAVEAMFVVYGDILIEDDPADNNDDLTIEGALVATGNIHFGRSLYTNNNNRPPVKVYFRPDMLGKMAEDGVGIISLQKSLVSQY